MPVRSPRYVYKISLIQVNIDEDAANTDDAPAETEAGEKRPIYVKMKKSIGDFLGLTPLPYTSTEWTGTFQAGQTDAGNTGSKYRKRLGGFRVASYTIIAKTQFTLTEYVRQQNGTYIAQQKIFKSLSIGFPTGHSVTEFIAFLTSTGVVEQVAQVRTPAGYSYHIAS